MLLLPKLSSRADGFRRFRGWNAQRPWTPRDLLGLEIWLDANQNDVSTNGDSVGTWFDQSGHAYNALTSGTQPVFATGGPNGRPYLNFGGAAKLAISHNANFQGNGDLEIFIVGRINGTATSGTLVAKNTAAGSPTAFLYRHPIADSHVHYLDGLNDLSALTATPLSTWRLFNFSRWGLVNGDHYFNETADGSSVVLNSGSYQANAKPILVGCDDGGANFLNGFIAEIVICSRVVPLAQRVHMRNYVRQKYGIF